MHEFRLGMRSRMARAVRPASMAKLTREMEKERGAAGRSRCRKFVERRSRPCSARRARNSPGPQAREWGARPNACSTNRLDGSTAAAKRRVPANVNHGRLARLLEIDVIRLNL